MFVDVRVLQCLNVYVCVRVFGSDCACLCKVVFARVCSYMFVLFAYG